MKTCHVEATISPEARAYGEDLRHRPGFGAPGNPFNLTGLRQGMFHVFQVRGLPESRQAVAHIADFIRACLALQQRSGTIGTVNGAREGERSC